MKLSIIITAWNEPETVGKTLDILHKDSLPTHEVIVVAPDTATRDVALQKKKKYKQVRTLTDKRKGKPAALRMAVKAAKGDVLILTDGDVTPSNTAFSLLYSYFEDKTIGAVSGHPISISPRSTMLGYWSHVLTAVAHARRQKAVDTTTRFFCSGYLFGIRKKLMPHLSDDILSEDGYISHCVYEQGYLIAYEPNAHVHVKYPTTFSDWITQKKRSAGGYNQIKERYGIEIRSFKTEAKGGFSLFSYVRSPKELVWLFTLFIARIYLWYRIYMDITYRKKSHTEIWKRVETTK